MLGYYQKHCLGNEQHASRSHISVRLLNVRTQRENETDLRCIMCPHSNKFPCNLIENIRFWVELLSFQHKSLQYCLQTNRFLNCIHHDSFFEIHFRNIKWEKGCYSYLTLDQSDFNNLLSNQEIEMANLFRDCYNCKFEILQFFN